MEGASWEEANTARKQTQPGNFAPASKLEVLKCPLSPSRPNAMFTSCKRGGHLDSQDRQWSQNTLGIIYSNPFILHAENLRLRVRKRILLVSRSMALEVRVLPQMLLGPSHGWKKIKQPEVQEGISGLRSNRHSFRVEVAVQPGELRLGTGCWCGETGILDSFACQ